MPADSLEGGRRLTHDLCQGDPSLDNLLRDKSIPLTFVWEKTLKYIYSRGSFALRTYHMLDVTLNSWEVRS